MEYPVIYQNNQTREYSRGVPTREPPYRRPTLQQWPEYASNDLSSTGKRMLWTINLRPGQKLIDEEQGLPALATNGNKHMEEYSKPKAPKDFSQRKVKVLEIVQARSIPEDEENETVILTDRDMKGDEKGNKVACETRWIHIRNNPMSFDDFQAVATEAPGLAKHEIALLLRLLKRVRQSCEKNFVHGRYLLPVACRYVGKKPNLKSEEKSKATFFSFPYFCLTPLSTLKHVGRHASLYPSRALLQSHYRLESTGERDKKQVVRKLGHWRNGEALYVSQLWCTLVDRSTIVTNADLDLSDLLGKKIRIEPYAAAIPAEAGLSTVQYTDLEGQLYFFPIAQCKTWFELRQTIEPTFFGAFYQVKLITEDGQLVTEENWSKRVEQEKSSRIRLTLTRKEAPSLSGSEDTNSDYGSLETPPSVTTLPMAFASSLSEETLEVPRADSPQDRINEDSMSYTIYGKDFKGRRKESEIAGLAEWQPAMETKYPIVINEQSLHKIGNPNLIEPSHSEATNGLESHGNASSSPITTSPPTLTQPSTAKARPSVTFTTRPDYFESSAPGETTSPERSGSEANNRQKDTTMPDSPQSANPRKRGSTKYPSAVSLDYECPTYPNRLDGERHHRSRPSRYSVRPSVYEEYDVVPTIIPPRQYRRRNPSYTRPRIRDQSVNGGRGTSVKPDDIYYNPPTVEKCAETPSISVSAASAPPENKSVSAEHTEGQKEGGETPVPESPNSIPRKGRRTPSVKRPVSPGSAKPTLLPIFLWPIGQSSTMNASDRAHKDTSNDTAESQNTHPGFRPFEINDETLAKILDDANKQLKNSKKTNEREAYASVEKRTLQDAEDIILNVKQYTEFTRLKAFAANGRELRTLELKKDILASTQQLLHAFVPRNYRSPIIDKYWGAVCSVLQDRGRLSSNVYSDDSSDDEGSTQPAVLYIQEFLSEFLDIIKYIQNGVSTGSVEIGQFRYQIPKALFEAFTRLVMIFVLYSSVSSAVDKRGAAKLARVASNSASQCKELLIKGKNQLILMIHTDDDGERVSYEALEPEVILALVMENLMERSFQAGEYELDLAEMYSEYMSQLEIKVQANPSVRQFRDIKYLSEELEIISKTLLSQRQVLQDYQTLVDGGENILIRQSYSNSLRIRIFNRSLQSVDQKIEEIKELRVRASNTQFLAAQTISVQTESKDKAILVFTVVTVIFLPLTFVTGYLGMNVQDVRNSSQGQGLFWSISLPITFVIFVAVLLLMAPSLRKRIFTVFPSRRDKDE